MSKMSRSSARSPGPRTALAPRPSATPQSGRPLCGAVAIPAIARQAVTLPQGASREQSYAAIATAAGLKIGEVKHSLLPREIALAYGFDGHRRTAQQIEDLIRSLLSLRRGQDDGVAVKVG